MYLSESKTKIELKNNDTIRLKENNENLDKAKINHKKRCVCFNIKQKETSRQRISLEKVFQIPL